MAGRIDPGDVSGVKSTARAEIERQKRAQVKREKQRGPKATYDLPARIIDNVREVADKERVSQSDVAALALVTFLERYHAGEVELQKATVRSVRFDYRLLLPEGWRD